MAAIMDIIIGSLLLLVGLVIWGYMFAVLCTDVLDASVVALIGLVPLVLAGGFLIKGLMASFTG